MICQAKCLQPKQKFFLKESSKFPKQLRVKSNKFKMIVPLVVHMGSRGLKWAVSPYILPYIVAYLVDFVPPEARNGGCRIGICRVPWFGPVLALCKPIFGQAPQGLSSQDSSFPVSSTMFHDSQAV